MSRLVTVYRIPTRQSSITVAAISSTQLNSMMRCFVALLALCSATNALRPAPGTARHRVVCHGRKTDALLGALRRVPLVKRIVKKKQADPVTPPPYLEEALDYADLIQQEADEAAKVLEQVVQQIVGGAAPTETPTPAPEKPAAVEESPLEGFDRLHAAGDAVDALLAQLRDASNEKDSQVEWRLARACLDAANALPDGDAKREGLVFEGLRAAERAATLAPDDGLAQKWLGVMLGSVGDFQTTKEKIQNSYKIRESLDAAYVLLPDDATVALALGQWCLKVAGVSFVERGLARAVFGGSPPEATYADALKFFQRAQELKPATKTKALVKLVEGKMRAGAK